MDRKLVGGIVIRQRDSSSFLSIFFFLNEGFLSRRETLDRTFVLFIANCGYTLIEVSVFQTKKVVFEKERSMLTFGTKKQRPYRWRVRWSDVGKGLTIFPDFSLSTINDRVDLFLSFFFSVLPFCNVCLSKPYFGFFYFFSSSPLSVFLFVSQASLYRQGFFSCNRCCFFILFYFIYTLTVFFIHTHTHTHTHTQTIKWCYACKTIQCITF